MNKEDVVKIDNGILLIHKKEWNNVIWSNMMDLENIMISEISQTEKYTNTIWYYLDVESKK